MVASKRIIFKQERIVTNNRSRRSIIISVALATLFLMGTALGAERPNFSGEWKLDKEKSTNLPEIFQAVEEFVLVVKQPDENSIVFFTQVKGHGQSLTGEEENYPINGTVVEKETNRGVKLKRSLCYDQDQRRLVIDSEKRFTGQVQLPDSNENEVWELSSDGKTLTVTVTPKEEGKQKQVRVFVKS
jgi:hypothetical protein